MDNPKPLFRQFGNLRWGCLFLLFWGISFPYALSESDCSKYESKKISEIVFDGLKSTQPQVVQRELLHKTGETFRCEDWTVERKKVESLDIFSSVSLKVKESEGNISLVYIFEELPLFLPFVGGKKTDQDGLILGPAVASFNLLGRDLRLEGYGRTSVEDFGSSNEYLFALSSYWLGSLPIEYWIGYIYTDSYNPFKNFPEKSHFYVSEFKQRLDDVWAIKYRAEFYTISTVDSITVSVGERDYIPRAGLGLLRDTRDSRQNTHEGVYSEFLYTHSGGTMGGDVDYGELLGDLYLYYPLTKKIILHYAFLGQYRFGGKVGAYDLFYVGGANSLRAYDPVADGFSGSSEILSFLELRYEFFDKKPLNFWGISWNYGLQGVVGYDVAYVWEHKDFTKGTDGKTLYTGLHILMPGLNRIRLELGNKAARFEVDMGFSLGLFERTSVQRFRIR